MLTLLRVAGWMVPVLALAVPAMANAAVSEAGSPEAGMDERQETFDFDHGRR